MSDLRTRLERIGDRAHPAPDAFARFEGKRRRRERNRRISAGVVAFVVAAAGSIGVFSLVGDDGENVLGGGQEGFFALWPEQTAEGLRAAQDAVDAGDPAFAWRTDPLQIAERFATEELLWPDALVTTVETEPPSEVNNVTIAVPPAASCDAIVTDAECPTGRVTLTMERLGRSDGLWSVTGVHSSDLALPLVAGDAVSAGSRIPVPTTLQDGEQVSMGIAFLSACGAAGTDDRVRVSNGLLVFDVPSVPDGCTGYVYAMRPPRGVGAVAIGSFLLTDAEEIPAIGYLIQEIAAVPVTFVDPAGTPSEPAQVGRISCNGADPIVQTPVVATQPDGVHVEVSNPTEQAISFSIGPDVGSPDEVVSSLAPGTVELVLTGAPGAMSFSCSPPPEEEGQAGVSGLGSFEVVDPAGNYVPAELECDTGSAYGGGAAEPSGGVGFAGDPVQVVRDHVSGLEFDDLVQRAGYVGSEQPVIRIVRADAVVGKVTLSNDGSGGWLISSIEGCGGTQFGWSEDPTGVSGPMGPTGSGSRPSGALGWCPAGPFLDSPPNWSQRASDAAIQFVFAYMNGDESASQALLDDSVPPGTVFSFELAEDAVLVTGTEGQGGEMVGAACGSEVDAHTVAVTIDDGTDSASLDFTLYLVLREDGWKIWGMY